jgi:hypothetical protein
MYEDYQSREGLYQADIDALLALYGERLADEFDQRQNNDSPLTANAVTVSGPESINADLGLGDADYYEVRLSGRPEAVVFRLHVEGQSLLMGELTVFDGVGGMWHVTATEPGQDIELTLPFLPKGRTYLVAVTAAGDSFSAGAYRLAIEPAGARDRPQPSVPVNEPPAQSPVIDLQPRFYRDDDRFAYFVQGEGETLYRFRSPAGQTDLGALTLFAWSSDPAAEPPRLTHLHPATGRTAARGGVPAEGRGAGRLLAGHPVRGRAGRPEARVPGHAVVSRRDHRRDVASF